MNLEPYQRLEREWAEWNRLPPDNMVVCSSGTAALHLAFEALRMPSHSRIVIPDFTMVACPRSVCLSGMTPLFVDCDSRLLVDASKIPPDADGIMPVHIYGRRCDMDAIHSWASGRVVVEDLSEIHGVYPDPRSSAAAWSFFKNKIIAGEEGGAVAFRDPAHATLARQLRSLGFTDAHDYWHVPRGHNYRMSNLHAKEILNGNNGLRVVEFNQERRREIEKWYDAACPPQWQQTVRDAVWTYDLRIPGMSPITQDRLVKTLRGQGIEARHGFKPCRNQPEWLQGWAECEWESDRASCEIIYLPVQPGRTTEADCRKAFDTIRTTLRAVRGESGE